MTTKTVKFPLSTGEPKLSSKSASSTARVESAPTAQKMPHQAANPEMKVAWKSRAGSGLVGLSMSANHPEETQE